MAPIRPHMPLLLLADSGERWRYARYGDAERRAPIRALRRYALLLLRHMLMARAAATPHVIRYHVSHIVDAATALLSCYADYAT